MGAGLAGTGCKSTPPLSQADAQKLIQAYYDQQPPNPVHIYVDYTGLKQGVDTKYWKVVKAFPANKNWGDLDLTDEGKKAYQAGRRHHHHPLAPRRAEQGTLLHHHGAGHAPQNQRSG